MANLALILVNQLFGRISRELINKECAAHGYSLSLGGLPVVARTTPWEDWHGWALSSDRQTEHHIRNKLAMPQSDHRGSEKCV